MKSFKKYQRVIATFLLLIFFPTVLPTNLFASNNGPAAPEATAFEPVDATDMVNLATGDMSYVLPLLNVPSPEGGYPLALSYHAGIAMDQEASWVGLGWNLNPGAINRSVSGVPDDWKRSKSNQIIYNAGGESTTYSGSVSVGWGSKGGYSIGLYGSYTENKTFGGTNSYRMDGGVTGSVGPLTGNIGTDGVGFGMAYSNNNISAGIGVNQSFNDGSTSISAYTGKGKQGDVGGTGSVGISWDSRNGLVGSVTGQAVRFSGNSYATGNPSITSQSFQGSIQIYCVNIGFGYSKSKYWLYESDHTISNGSLYPSDMVTLYNEDNFPRRVAFDSYNSIYKLDGDEQLDGDNLSFVAYDNYSASGQGISGTFKPGIYEQGSLINNYKEASINYSTVSFQNGTNNSFTKGVDNSASDINFYFDNEIASFLRVSSANWLTNVANTGITSISPSTNLLSTSTIDGVTYNGYNSATKRMRTGNYIEAFTNGEIISSNSTIIINPENYNRANAPASGIGAFRITGLDGKVYHYSIPVYQKQQFSKSTDIDADFENKYMENIQLESYATHWLLTAITGPDYFDANQNNKVDESDYGYWTSFDYGKWSDGFPWCTPLKKSDKSKMYEWGVKEIYYLDKIKTRTHTAYFIKEARQDDLSYQTQIGNNENDLSWKNNVSRSFIEGKDNLWYFKGVFQHQDVLSATNGNSMAYTVAESSSGRYIKFNQHKSLKLNKIVLLKNSDATLSKSSGPSSSFSGQIKFEEKSDLYNVNGQYLNTLQKVVDSGKWYGEFYDNVFDISDLPSATEQKAIKSVRFDYATWGLLGRSSRNSSAPEGGKLTLNAINFIGKNKTQLIPPYKFSYLNNALYSEDNEDNWGYVKYIPQAWSLNRITTPEGGQINVVYESDDFDREAVSGFRGFDSELEYVFYQEGDKLKILVRNEYQTNKINFLDYFQIGQTNLDLWAALKHDYNDWGCETRKASVDINTPNIQIVSVSSSSIILETSMSAVYESNGGFGWMSYKDTGLNNHPGSIRENLKRGEMADPPGCINVSDRLVLVYKLLGNKSIVPNSEKKGGGIRVKELNVSENGIVKNRTKYFYNVPGYNENPLDANYKSSGITSYAPQKYFKEIKYRSELPSPGVMYEYVTVKNFSANNELGSVQQYNFHVLKPDAASVGSDLLIDNVLEINKTQNYEIANGSSGSESYKLNLSKFNIKDMMANLGRLKSVKTFNKQGQLLSVSNNDFYGVNDINQGIREESFNTYKRVNTNGNLNYRLGITSKTKYPNVIKKSSVTQHGITTESYFDKFDFLTGQVLETRMVNSNGQSFKTKVVPAYVKYSEMGSKADNIDNRNMLSQVTANYSYMLDNATTSWKETGVGITTWSNQWIYQDVIGDKSTPTNPKEKIWRKHKTYIWNGVLNNNTAINNAGTFLNYNSATDDGFNWAVGVGSQPSKWKQISEITLYDRYSKALESKDINNNLASTKMSWDGIKIMATGNAGYNEMYYAGAENSTGGDYWLEPEVRMANGVRTNVKAHTGKWSVKATDATQFGVFMRNGHRASKYKLSVWVHKSNAEKARVRWFNNDVVNTFQFNGEQHTAGDWILMTHYIDSQFMMNTAAYFYVNSIDNTEVYFDDFMLRPIASTISGYVYNEYDELTYIIGNNGLATKFEYDAAGRLVKTYVEVVDDLSNGVTGGFKTKSANAYNYRLNN